MTFDDVVSYIQAELSLTAYVNVDLPYDWDLEDARKLSKCFPNYTVEIYRNKWHSYSIEITIQE